jgi:hypothetical protein
MTIKVVFKNGDRTYRMKVKETLKNGDVILIDGSTVEKKDIIETIKEK